MNTFNYIITIHNKENLIKDVLLSVINCAGLNSYIYPVLDGCTDNSESIIDELIKNHPSRNIIKCFANDVHELKSINIGLRAATQNNTTYNIILQDDVLLIEDKLEDKILKLYKEHPNLGVVSLRHGGNISTPLLLKNSGVPFLKNYIENEKGHNPNPLADLPLGYFTYREVAIKSPICISSNLIQAIGLPDEDFAPWDDVAYCFKAMLFNFNNGVFAVEFVSDLEWGTTRQKKQEHSLSEVETKNKKLLKSKFIKEISEHKKKKIYNSKKYKIFNSNTNRSNISVYGYLIGIKKYLSSQVGYYVKIVSNK